MLKLKLTREFRSLLVSRCKGPCTALLLLVQDKAYSTAPHINSTNFALAEYLTNTLKFPESKVSVVFRRFPSITSSEKPEAVLRFFKTLGISDTQIQSCVRIQPSILFLDVEKILKPKIAFLQESGLCGPHLGMIISKNPCLLTSSLDRRLKPCIGVIKEALELNRSENSNANVSDLLNRILSRHSFSIGMTSRFHSNITYLRNCGVVGSQLIMLMRNEPRLFWLSEAQLKLLVSRATEMGFEIGSRMLVYGITSLYCSSAETVRRKFEILQDFGFSWDEFKELIVKAPTLLNTSEAKLRRGIEFYLHTLMLDKPALVRAPALLSMSMEKTVIPRCKILETLKATSLLEKEPSYVTSLFLSKKQFVKRYILEFADDAKLMQVAHEYNLLESPKT